LVSAGTTKMFTPIRLLSIAIISSLIGGIGLLMNYGVIIPSIIFIVWISFSYGTVMPTAFAIAATAFPEHKGKAVGVLASMGSIGGLTLPWIAGLLVAQQPIQSFVWFVDFWIAILLVALFFVNKNLVRGQQPI
jgi:MFS family permease